MGQRIGADIGGTFTDLVLVDDDGALVRIAKVLTTPAHPDAAVEEGVRELLGQAAVDPAAIAHVVHGTTLFTNALIERKGARTALITTRGFRDAIEIGREHRYDMYDLSHGAADAAGAAPSALRARRARAGRRQRADAARSRTRCCA